MPKQKSSTPSRPIASTFQIVEAYKAIRTNLLFSVATSKSKVIIISSAEPSAGKSTVASNLAITMAQTGARVLLIDADMRKPAQHKVFRLRKHNGLSMILSGLMTYEECVYREVAKGLDLITSGTLPPNPCELLGSEAMGKFLNEMQEQYDYIFVDTPPLCVVSDALVLSDKSAGIALICRQRQTTYDELQNAIDNVKDVQGNVLGVIITDMREHGQTYGKYKREQYYRSYTYAYTASSPDGSDK